MALDSSVFFEAFANAGFVQPAFYWHTGLFAPIPFNADLNKPSADVMETVRDCDFMIEYETAAVPQLRKGGLVHSGGKLYRVSEPPKPQGDGYFAMVDLMFLGTTTASFQPAVAPWVLSPEFINSTLTEGPE